MTVSRVAVFTGTNAAGSASQASQPGDLFIAFAFRDGNTTAPSLPTGWSQSNNGGANAVSSRVAYRESLASTTAINGTWTNATSIDIHQYRTDIPGGRLTVSGNGIVAVNGGSSSTINFPAKANGDPAVSTWKVGFAGHASIDTSLETPPSGMTNYSSVVDATDEAAGHDTNGATGDWPSTNVSVGGTTGGWRTAVIEISEFEPSDPQDFETKNGATFSNGNKSAIINYPFALNILSKTGWSVGLHFAEITINALPSTTTNCIYVGNLGGTDYVRYFGDGSVVDEASASLGTLQAFTAGDVIGIAVDKTNGKLWLRKNNGNWNNNGTADPASKTGGLTLPSAAPVYVGFATTATTPGIKATINTGPTFTNTKPAGFDNWFGTVPLFRDVQSTTYASRSTSAAVTKPVGLAVGDLMLWQHLTFASNSGAVSVAFPGSGAWLPLVSGTPYVDTYKFGTYRYYVAYKFADAADVAASNFSATISGTANEQGSISAYSGVASVEDGTIRLDASPADTIRTANSVTTTAAEDIVVFLGADFGDNGPGETPPDGFTERLDNALLYHADVFQAAIGASGNKTNSCNSASGNPRVGALVALKQGTPPGGGGTTTPQGVSISSSTSVAAAKLAARRLAIASASSVASAKASYRRIAIASVTSTLVAAGKALSQAISIAANSSVSLLKRAGKAFAVSAGTSTATNRTSSKGISLSAATAVVVTSTKALLRSVSISVSAGLSTSKRIGKTAAITIGSAATSVASRAFLLAVSISAGTAVSARRAVAKSALLISGTSLLMQKAVGRSLPIASFGAVTSRNAVSASRSIGVGSVIAAVKSAQRRLAMSVVSSVSQTYGSAFARVVSISVATSTGVSRYMGKSVTIASTSIVAARRQTSKALQAPVSIAVSARKLCSKAFTTSVATAAGIARTVSKRVSASLSASVLAIWQAAAKQYDKAVDIVSATNVAVRRSAQKRVTASVLTTVTGVKSAAVRVSMAANMVLQIGKALAVSIVVNPIGTLVSILRSSFTPTPPSNRIAYTRAQDRSAATTFGARIARALRQIRKAT